MRGVSFVLKIAPFGLNCREMCPLPPLALHPSLFYKHCLLLLFCFGAGAHARRICALPPDGGNGTPPAGGHNRSYITALFIASASALPRARAAASIISDYPERTRASSPPPPLGEFCSLAALLIFTTILSLRLLSSFFAFDLSRQLTTNACAEYIHLYITHTLLLLARSFPCCHIETQRRQHTQSARPRTSRLIDQKRKHVALSLLLWLMPHADLSASSS